MNFQLQREGGRGRGREGERKREEERERLTLYISKVVREAVCRKRMVWGILQAEGSVCVHV